MKQKRKSLEYLKKADFIFHLGGVNRPSELSEFNTDNVEFTRFITDSLMKYNRCTPIAFSSSIQIDANNDYGKS